MADQDKSKRRLINEFQRRKNSYITTYKKIKRLVESAAGQKTFDDATKDRFHAAALDSNIAHKEFREFLLPFFPETAIKEIFPEEALAEENEGLKSTVQELQRNKQVLDALVQELSEKCHIQNEKLLETGNLQETVSNLQKQLEDYKNQNLELRKAINDDDFAQRRMRKHSEQKNEQQDLLIRDLEHRISFRLKGQQNGNRRDRYIDQSLEKIYKLNEELDSIGAKLKASFVKGDGTFSNLQEPLLQVLIKLDDVASSGHLVIRSERALAIKKAQTLLEMLNSKGS